MTKSFAQMSFAELKESLAKVNAKNVEDFLSAPEIAQGELGPNFSNIYYLARKFSDQAFWSASVVWAREVLDLAAAETLLVIARNTRSKEVLSNLVMELQSVLGSPEWVPVVSAVCNNRWISGSDLVKLSNSEIEDVRILVAGNLSIRPKLAMKMARDESILVRAALAQNRNLPVDAVLMLSRDDEFVQGELAGNRRIAKSPAVVLKFSKSNSLRVLRKLAANKVLSDEQLAEIVTVDTDAVAVMKVANNPKSGAVTIRKIFDIVSSSKHSLNGGDGMESLYRSYACSRKIVAALSTSKNASPEILEWCKKRTGELDKVSPSGKG